ncbi:translation initiation factor IF-1A [Candidatus Pacearchaeota archaeon]|nr:translation initiation factor IF-1A [Candidatus Pacearchaeota archaeon]
MADDAYGDFEEVKEESEEPVVEGGEVVVRARLPKKDELIGVIVQRYGGNRMEVKSTDGKSRNCRVPGRYRRGLWLRPGDYVLIAVWPDDPEKGDLIFKYQGSMLTQLRKKGLLAGLDTGF